ncbi:MAG: hypothetical protein IJG68_00245 [Bacilli bacterium]|nr:hypothetical protein [Bacilli bacterium]
MNQIHHLYQEYQDKSLDDQFLKNAFEIMMEEDIELSSYVKELKIKGDCGKKLGTFDQNSKELSIYLDGISRMYKKNKIYALAVLRHELEHARNMKKLNEGRDDIESTIIRYSLKDYCYINGLIYKDIDDLDIIMLAHRIRDNYELDPGERLADIKAWKYLVNIFKNKRSEELLESRSMLYYSFIRGYHDNRYYLESPTLQFLLNTYQLRDHYLLQKRIKEKDYSFDTRLLCGLPITNAEYEKGTLIKAKVRKKVR